MNDRTAPAISLRPAIATDQPALRTALVELQEYERDLRETRLPAESFVDRYLRWMLQQVGERDGLCLVAESAGCFVGFVSAWIERIDWAVETPDSARYGYVSDICVLAPWRGRRIAAQLLDAAAAHLRERGMVRMRIGVLANNAAAIAAYRRAGFAPYEMTMEKMLR